MNLYYSLILAFDSVCVENVGHFKKIKLIRVESSLKYHPSILEILTVIRYPDSGQCLVGSLTGAVSSQKVTEELKGFLSTVGNRTKSAKV